MLSANVTFKAIVINRRKDGTYPVKIRVTFKGVSRRLPTTLVANPGDLTRTLHIKSPDILNRADALIRQMRDAIKDISPFDLDIRDVDWVVSRIKDALTEESFHLDFFAWSDMFLQTKKEGNRMSLATAVNALERFVGCRKLDINDISRQMVMDFIQYIDNEPKICVISQTKEAKITDKAKSSGASTRYVQSLSHIFSAAKDRYNDDDSGRVLIPRSPFDKITKNKLMPIGQSNIGKDVMQMIISAKPEDPKIRMALDLFIVSFALMGANMVDLFNAKSFKGDWWIYNRSKTKDRRSDQAEMRVLIPEELKPYLERLKGHGGHWLCICEEYSNKDTATTTINKFLGRWCEQMDVPRFTFYAARHTFASIGRSIGIEKATIDDCLNHKGDYSVADIYAEKAWEFMQEANRKVLDLFTWE